MILICSPNREFLYSCDITVMFSCFIVFVAFVRPLYHETVRNNSVQEKNNMTSITEARVLGSFSNIQIWLGVNWD